MKRRVVVTGLGVVTSLSLKVEDLFERLCRGESGVHLIRQFDTTDYKVKFGGDVYDWDTGDYIDKKEVKRIDRFTQFALVAGIDAVRDSGLDLSKEEPFRCGVILGSGIGGLNEIETQMARLLFKGPDRVSALTIPKLMLNAAGGNLSIHFGIRGPNYTVATACASATNAIGDAFKTIQYDDADIMLTGGTEAAVTPMGVSGFQNMRALSMRNDDPPRASRPFDADRDGFVLAEGAGLLVLEELEHAKARGADLCRSLGFRRQRRRRAHHPARRTRAGGGSGDGLRLARRSHGPLRDGLHQCPRHQYAAGRQGGNLRDEGRFRGTCQAAEHLEHQEQLGAYAGGQRRNRTGGHDQGHRAQPGTAYDQPADAGSRLRFGLHAQPASRARYQGRHEQQLWVRRP